jgi:hypothetical protein
LLSGIITYFASELLRLMPEAFFPADLSHLPTTFTSGLGRYANRRRRFGLSEAEVRIQTLITFLPSIAHSFDPFEFSHHVSVTNHFTTLSF